MKLSTRGWAFIGCVAFSLVFWCIVSTLTL